ncbi:helicase-related protein [Rhodoferax sp.]|uniref:helicase-related protein n=1 Tax=Rhodoferax sp. TaxID=50421 RepID=UPI0025CBC892|nr:helicase-related protein [Rhodoferax sp.]
MNQALRLTQSGLKDFQRATVDEVIRLFGEKDHSGRVLVADEVGLGKTIVARGVIASLLAGWTLPRPMRVTYICSNLALAGENRKKLAVFSEKLKSKYVRGPSFSRLAEVVDLSHTHEDDGAVLEICSLTPSTSFSLTSGSGNMRERLLIFAAILRVFSESLAQQDLMRLEAGLTDLFRARVENTERWNADLATVKLLPLCPEIVGAFGAKLAQLVDQACPADGTWLVLLRRIAMQGMTENNPNEASVLRRLRQIFVGCCAANLRADLFILDEFQRFKELIEDSEDSDQGLIAKQVFHNEQRSKVLLLSATPFKAVTTPNDDEVDQGHLGSLKQILTFLNLVPLDAYEPARKRLQSEMLRLRQKDVAVDQLSEQPRMNVENILRPLITRTERSQIAANVDDVLDELKLECKDFRPLDIQAFIELDRLVVTLEKNLRTSMSGQMMEFFKSAAWPLTFCTGYKLQDELVRQFKTDPDVAALAVGRARQLWLPRDKVNQFQLNVARDAPNPKVRMLTRHLFGDDQNPGPELLLWVPPSLPHYPLAGPFAAHGGFSKTLVFSAWAMVPRMLSGLLSYESERRTLGKRVGDSRYFLKRKKGSKVDSQEDNGQSEASRMIRLDAGDLAYWSLLYPSKVLIDARLEQADVPLDQLIADRTKLFEELLLPLATDRGGGQKNHWYFLAPVLLDSKVHTDASKSTLWSDAWLTEMRKLNLSDSVTSRLTDIATQFEKDPQKLGEMPDDLAHYLAMLSIGSPAVCAYRALQGAYPEEKIPIGLASKVALSFVGLFNSLSGGAVIRRVAKRKNWHGILEYCVNGGMQAMLSEYLFMLSSSNDAPAAVDAIQSALGVNPSNVKLWRVDQKDDTHLRCHYAVPFGTQKTSDEAGLKRVVSIRESFNSPFRPFVLTSTSIGQEGLDFHWYCSDVVHWNLPENAIDIEQREGRVNRYQSYMVRRRVVESYKSTLRCDQGWSDLFGAAALVPNRTDLVPFWHFPDGTAKLRRIVPLLPLSREDHVYAGMLKILSLYRLAFGQPGQCELLEYLKDLKLSEPDLMELRSRLMIRLAPLLYAKEHSNLAGTDAPLPDGLNQTPFRTVPNIN